MKKISSLLTATILVVAMSSFLNASGNTVNAENYHHALYLCFQHAADHAEALYQESLGTELNTQIALDYVDQIGKDLDRARVYHAMVHKTFSDADAKLIAEEHAIILNGHAAATSAFNDLKKEMENLSPSMSAIKTLSAAIYAGANKAAVAHLAAMKKLGIKPVEAPSA